MKAVKIVLGIIVVLSVVFLGTGLVVKENTYATQIDINKPVELVFKKFNDMAAMKQWIPEIVKIDTLNFNPGITGSQFALYVDNKGQEVRMEEKVLAFVRNKKVTFFYDAEGMLKTATYTFTENKGTTRIELKAAYKSEDSYILSCFFPYFKGTVKGLDEQYLSNFKGYIER